MYGPLIQAQTISDPLAVEAMRQQAWGALILALIVFLATVGTCVWILHRALGLLANVSALYETMRVLMAQIQQDAQRPWIELSASHDKTVEAMTKLAEALGCLKAQGQNQQETARTAVDQCRIWQQTRTTEYQMIIGALAGREAQFREILEAMRVHTAEIIRLREQVGDAWGTKG